MQYRRCSWTDVRSVAAAHQMSSTACLSCEATNTNRAAIGVFG